MISCYGLFASLKKDSVRACNVCMCVRVNGCMKVQRIAWLTSAGSGLDTIRSGPYTSVIYPEETPKRTRIVFKLDHMMKMPVNRIRHQARPQSESSYTFLLIVSRKKYPPGLERKYGMGEE